MRGFKRRKVRGVVIPSSAADIFGRCRLSVCRHIIAGHTFRRKQPSNHAKQRDLQAVPASGCSGVKNV